MRLRKKILGGAGFLALLLTSHYWLPVRQVWYGHQMVSLDHMTTPHAWENLIESWDWVEGYSLTWVYPAMLKVDLIRKKPIAKTGDNRYISTEGSFFSLGMHQVNVPTLIIPDQHVSSALSLMDTLESVQSIKEYPSGTVEVVLTSQDRILLPDYEKPKHYDKIMQNAKNAQQNSICDFRDKKYANCK